jgi:type II secretory pathway component PulC
MHREMQKMSISPDKIFTRQFHHVILVSLALCAYFTARGTNNLLASELLSEIDNYPGREISRPIATTAPFPASSLPQPPVRDGQVILRRNIFSSAIGPILPASQRPPEESIDIPPDETGLSVEPCEASFHHVLATVVSETYPQWSFVSIATKEGTSLYRQGDRLDEREILGISWRHVFLKGDNNICYIDLFGEKNLEAVARKQFTPQKNAIPKRFRKDVSQIGPNARQISRKLARRLSSDPSRYARQLRLRPYKKSGDIIGFRVRRLPGSSPFAALGLKRGDVINAVNGTNLTSVRGAMDAYNALKNKPNYTFSITRRGKPLELKVRVK